MTKCKNCEFWKEDLYDYRDGTPRDLAGYKSCTCTHIKRWFTLAPTNHLTDRLAALPTDGAVVEFDEAWGIITGPDFGCVHGKSHQEPSP